MHTILLANTFPSMLGCSSLLPSEAAFLIHSLFQLQKYLLSRRRMTNATSQFFFFISSQLRLLRLPFWTTITILFVGCNKDSEQFFFFSKKRTELEVHYTFLPACSITGASLQFCFSFFFHITHEEIHDHRPLAVLHLLRPRSACFFFFTLFPAHTFLILILQTASYKTHACWLTLITRGCGVLRSTRVC